MQVTATDPVGAGSLTVFPCGSPRPPTVTAVFAKGQPASGFAVTAPGTKGHVCVLATARTHLHVDLRGWYGPDQQL